MNMMNQRNQVLLKTVILLETIEEFGLCNIQENIEVHPLNQPGKIDWESMPIESYLEQLYDEGIMTDGGSITYEGQQFLNNIKRTLKQPKPVLH